MNVIKRKLKYVVACIGECGSTYVGLTGSYSLETNTKVYGDGSENFIFSFLIYTYISTILKEKYFCVIILVAGDF